MLGAEQREYYVLLPLTQIKISKFEDPKYLCLTTTNLRFLEHFSRGLKYVETSVRYYHFFCITDCLYLCLEVARLPPSE